MVWLRLSGILGKDGVGLWADVGSIPGAARKADGKGARGRGRAGALRCLEDAEAGRFIKDEQRKKAQKRAREKGREGHRKREREGRERGRQRASLKGRAPCFG